jgi:drug/metabolite transporter (DMT)-like permease
MMNILLLIVTGTLISILFALGKAATGLSMSPVTILAWQIMGAAMIMMVVTAVARVKCPPVTMKHLRYYFISGILGVSLPAMLAYMAVQDIGVGLVGLVTALSTLLTYVLALFFGMERYHVLRLVGVLLGLFGVSMLFVPQMQGDVSFNGAGLLCALAIPLSLASGNVYRTHAWPKDMHPLALTTGMLLAQCLVVLPVAVVYGDFYLPSFSLRTVDLVLLLIGPVAAAAYSAIFLLQRQTGPVYLSQLGYVITVVGMLLGMVFFGEQYSSDITLVIAYIVVGLVLVNHQSGATLAVIERELVPVSDRPGSSRSGKNIN